MVNGPRLRMFLVMRVDEEVNGESEDMTKEVVEVAKEDEVMTDEWGAGKGQFPSNEYAHVHHRHLQCHYQHQHQHHQHRRSSATGA